MKQEMKELKKIRGIGEVLSRRLVEAGFDTLAKVAALDEETLQKIPGMNPRITGSILAHAGELAAEAERERAAMVKDLQQQASSLKVQVQELARAVRDRFGGEIGGKDGRKAEKEVLKVITSLEGVEGIIETRVNTAGKVLAKTGKRLEGLADTGLRGVGKGLKKARKSLQRALVK
ncbi:MAG TPA: helix-hairpin-helix domain-containing protein [Geobacteraceae bacterium]|nr:helix-hairpin-helix domain-containing protein [Geobacteraceae bacterium]